MNCSDISKSTPLYLAGELEPARAEVFAAHLRNCPACTQELGQQTELDHLLRTSVLAEQIDSSSVDVRARASIRAARVTARRQTLTAAGVAAALLVGLAGYGELASSRTKRVYAAAARDHRTEIVDRQPRKWLTDYASIQKLAEGAGLSGFNATDFMAAGYHLAQGKLCLVDGQVFLHLVYANDNGDFSLFLQRPHGAPGWGIHTGTFAAEHVAGFRRGPFKALIVSEQPGDFVLRLAKFAETAL